MKKKFWFVIMDNNYLFKFTSHDDAMAFCGILDHSLYGSMLLNKPDINVKVFHGNKTEAMELCLNAILEERYERD